MRNLVIATVLTLASLAFAEPALGLDASLLAEATATGTELRLHVSGASDASITVQSDLTARSGMPVPSDRVVSVGTLRGPGVFVVRITDGADPTTFLVVASPTATDPKLLQVSLSKLAGGTVPSSTGGSLEKFWRLMTAQLLLKSLEEEWVDWASSNAVSITGTVVVCLAATAVPGLVGTCILDVAGQGMDLLKSTLVRSADNLLSSKQLTKPERDTVVSFVRALNSAAQLALSSGVASKLVSALGSATDFAFEGADASATGRLYAETSVGASKKILVLIDIAKKAK